MSYKINDGNVRMAVTDEEVVESWKKFFNRSTNWKDFPQVTSYEEYRKITDKQHLSKKTGYGMVARRWILCRLIH